MSEGRARDCYDGAPGLRRWRATGEYLLVAAASLALAWSLLELWRADLRVPFDYRGDGILHSMTVKAIIENGGYLTNPRLGAPAVLHHHDFPFASEWAHIAAIRLLALLSSSWACVINIYFILGFPLIAISAFAVFRHFGIRFAPAAVGGILYAFLPSRMLKGESHLFLDTFYQVPLAILVVIWVSSDAPPLVRAGQSRWRVSDLWHGRSAAAICICILVASTDLYYAFFTGFLLIAGGIWASAERRSVRNAVAGLAQAAIVLVGVLANLAPSLVYQARHGANPDVGHRLPQEAEMYGMRIAQMLLPVPQHRLAPLRQFTAIYEAMTHGGEASSLGAVSSIGFLILLGRVVSYRNRPRDHGDLIRALAVFNLFAVLFATLGGFGSLFAWLVSPQIRTYSRMNVVIGFLSLFAIVLALDRLDRRARWLQWSVAAGVLVVGLLDQVTPAAVRDYGAVKAAFAADAKFVDRIERGLPRDAAVFELPYHSYPEGGAQYEMADYDLLRPYLHSRTVRWSYPAMRNRFDDVWTRQVAEETPARMVSVLSDAGFGGVLIDRAGYADKGSDIEAALGRILEATPEVSTDGRMAFYDLTAEEKRSVQNDASAEREQRRDRALHPLLVRWGGGFWYPETAPDGTYRWGSHSGEVGIQNGSPAAKWASIRMTAFAARPPARLVIGGDLLSETVELRTSGTSWARTVLIPPGDHVLRFHSDSEPVQPRLDTRTLVWIAENLKVTELDAGARSSP